MLAYCWLHNKGERRGFVQLNSFDGMNCKEKRMDEAWLLFAIIFFVLAAMWGMQNSQKRMASIAAKGELMERRGMQRDIQQEGVKHFSDLDLLVFR